MFLYTVDGDRYAAMLDKLGYTLYIEKPMHKNKYEVNGKGVSIYSLKKTNVFAGFQPQIYETTSSGEIFLYHSGSSDTLSIDEYTKYIKSMQKVCDILEDINSDNEYLRKKLLAQKQAGTLKINAAKRLSSLR